MSDLENYQGTGEDLSEEQREYLVEHAQHHVVERCGQQETPPDSFDSGTDADFG